MKATVCALAAFAVLAFAGVSVASASPPVITRYPDTTLTTQVPDICPSPYTLTMDLTGWTEQVFFDTNGNLAKVNYEWFEQDTFTGPAGTLTGEKYHSHMQVLLDSSGNVTSIYLDGGLEKVWLPDGTFFITAGRTDVLARTTSVILNPDHGHSGNIAEFCAALGVN